MGISRRSALKVLAAATGTTVATSLAPRRAEGALEAPPDALGMLYDTTRCIGCRACMVACNEANDLPPDTSFSGGLWQMPIDLNGQTKNIIKLYRDDETGSFSFIKQQCMHCIDPACTAACMLGALRKGEHGIVTYNADLCIGCRYCQMACPFNVPKFEWSEALAPKIVKCELCAHRIPGKGPACCEVCPTGAVIYGRRADLLDEAHRRLDERPDRYVPSVYGEHEAGGTQVLYLSHVEFEKLGLPPYPDEPVPETVRSVQHTIYRGFVAPVALYGLLAGILLRRRSMVEAAPDQGVPARIAPKPKPVGGRVFAGPALALVALAAVALGLVVWRFVAGLGATTALNDGYPWGLWIAFDVVTGTALGCGGYAMALLVYILNRGKYHPLVRPALVTSAFGYTIAGFSVLLDVGRPWLVWKVPLYFWSWNLSSVLLEVALCIFAYTLVLWVELSPAFLEKARTSGNATLRRVGETWLPRLRRAMPWVIALGILLPTMHQSSLGSLLLLSGPRLHPLWNTALLPLLFLISSIAMGYAMVVIEGSLSSRFHGKRAAEILAGLGLAMLPVLGLYLALRIVDIAARGQMGALLALDRTSILALIELGLVVVPLSMLATEWQRRDLGNVFRAAMLLLLAGALYRFDVFLVAFSPGPHFSYFPNVTEILITTGLVAIEILGYVALIKLFPILVGEPQAEPAT